MQWPRGRRTVEISAKQPCVCAVRGVFVLQKALTRRRSAHSTAPFVMEKWLRALVILDC